MIVYKITNKINGKIYIGQTIRPLIVRWKHHCNPANKNCTALHRAIQKYGRDMFTVEQIDVACDRDELDTKERYWINYYDCIAPKGYNLRLGGEHHIVSEETRYKLGNGNRGRRYSEEIRKKMSESRRGRKMSPEAILKAVATKRANGVYEKIAKISALNGKKSGKPIRCLETGEIFESVAEAARKHNLHRANISFCVRGDGNRTCGKLHWEYV